MSLLRPCASVSPSPSLTPSPGWAIATAPWIPLSTHSSWETLSELWVSSCPAAPRGQPDDLRLRSRSRSATLGILTWPAAPHLPWPLTWCINLPLPLMQWTCWMLNTQAVSCLCSCPIKWTTWIEVKWANVFWEDLWAGKVDQSQQEKHPQMTSWTVPQMVKSNKYKINYSWEQNRYNLCFKKCDYCSTTKTHKRN